jgi:hypothetical protein
VTAGRPETSKGDTIRVTEGMMQTSITMQEEALPVVKSSLQMKRKALEFNSKRYEARLAAFELQHAMTSQMFADKFDKGELGDDEQWFEWEFVLEVYQETKRQLQLLETIKL